MKSKRDAKPGEPCDHPGRLAHVTHPCEGCGRTAVEGYYFAQHNLGIPWEDVERRSNGGDPAEPKAD